METSPLSKDFTYLGHEVRVRELIDFHHSTPFGVCSIYVDGRFQRYERGNKADELAKQIVEGKVAYEAWEKERTARSSCQGVTKRDRFSDEND
jgi:hypothetical protein